MCPGKPRRATALNCACHGCPHRWLCPLAPWGLLALLLSAAAGCHQEMANQPRHDVFEESAAFNEGLWSRKPVAGTVPRGELQLDDAFFTGRVRGELVTELPARALADGTLADLVTRGQVKYNAFCSHCHGQVGGGIGDSEAMREAVGMVVKRGFPPPPTYHQERLRQAPIGHFYDVITNGLGRMASHGYLLAPQDRWAIAVYIRALQLGQNASRDVLTDADLSNVAPSLNAESQPSSITNRLVAESSASSTD